MILSIGIALGTVFLGLFLLVISRMLIFTVRYQLSARKLPASIPRQKSLFPFLMGFNLCGGYEKFLAENQDENGNPYPVVNQGPQIDGSLMIAFSGRIFFLSNLLKFINQIPTCAKRYYEIQSCGKNTVEFTTHSENF
jgi:hypothetical protein